jgi:hypothetical protein
MSNNEEPEGLVGDIMTAVTQGSIQEMTELLDKHPEFDINKATTYDEPVLMAAMEMTTPECFRALLSRDGVDPNVTTKMGASLLHATDDKDMIAVLFEHKKFNPNIRNAELNTALSEAVEEGNYRKVAMIIAHVREGTTSLDANFFDKEGWERAVLRASVHSNGASRRSRLKQTDFMVPIALHTHRWKIPEITAIFEAIDSCGPGPVVKALRASIGYPPFPEYESCEDIEIIGRFGPDDEEDEEARARDSDSDSDKEESQDNEEDEEEDEDEGPASKRARIEE